MIHHIMCQSRGVFFSIAPNGWQLHARFNAAKPLLCSRCGSFSSKFQSKKGFFNLFFVRRAKILLLKISTLQIKLQISEKYFTFFLCISYIRCIFVPTKQIRNEKANFKKTRKDSESS